MARLVSHGPAGRAQGLLLWGGVTAAGTLAAALGYTVLGPASDSAVAVAHA